MIRIFIYLVKMIQGVEMHLTLALVLNNIVGLKRDLLNLN